MGGLDRPGLGEGERHSAPVLLLDLSSMATPCECVCLCVCVWRAGAVNCSFPGHLDEDTGWLLSCHPGEEGSKKTEKIENSCGRMRGTADPENTSLLGSINVKFHLWGREASPSSSQQQGGQVVGSSLGL